MSSTLVLRKAECADNESTMCVPSTLDDASCDGT